MISKQDVEAIHSALDMAIASHKRAKNTKRNPAFDAIYEQEIARLESIKTLIKSLQEPATKK